jgi:hypothetical protein
MALSSTTQLPNQWGLHAWLHGNDLTFRPSGRAPLNSGIRRLLSGCSLGSFQGFLASFQRIAPGLPDPSLAASLQVSKLVNFSSSVAHVLRCFGHSSLGRSVLQSSNYSSKRTATPPLNSGVRGQLG